MIKSLFIHNFHRYVKSYKYTSPLLFFIIGIVVTYSQKNNPIMSSYSITSLLIFIISAWITMGFMEIEDITQQQLLIIYSKNQEVYYISKIIFLTSIIIILDIFSVLYPIIGNFFDGKVSMCNLSLAFLSHAVFGLLGISVSSLFNSRIIKNRKNAILFLMLIITVSIIQEPLTKNFPILKCIIYLLPPASITAEQIGNENTTEILIFLVLCTLYSWLLLITYIKLMKKKMF